MKKTMLPLAGLIVLSLAVAVIRHTASHQPSQPFAVPTGPGKDDARPEQSAGSPEPAASVRGQSLTSALPVRSPVTDHANRESDPLPNPYAASLHEPGRSKRAWDAAYIEQFQHAGIGDPVEFELTEGLLARGRVRILQYREGRIGHVAGELTAPEAGTFFILRPPEGGKAGKAVAVVEFPGSRTAYRVEPTGEDGEPELWRRRLDEVVCMNMPEIEETALPAGELPETMEVPPLNPGAVVNYDADYNTNLNGTAIVSLQSLPGSPAVILLDFLGGYTPHWGGVDYAPPPVSNGRVREIWTRVAEDYLPFHINVTTDIKVYLAAPAASRQRCCFTTTPVTAAGVAYFGSWNWGNDAVCWSVYYNWKGGSEVASHEVGHTLGLSHQTQDIPDGMGGTTHNEYYGGHGSGVTGWAPVMGVGYDQPVSTWAKGEYLHAGQTEDELQIVTTVNNNVAYRPDDTGDALGTSRYLEVYPDDTAFAEGVIERTGDTDAFQFTTAGGALSLAAEPVSLSDNTLYNWANLAVMVTLADSSGTVIASNNPQNTLSASISTTVTAGTYTFRVTGAGRNDPLTGGFSAYASLGYYSVTGSVTGVRQPTRLTVAEHAPDDTVVGTVSAANPNSSPLIYSIQSGNTGGTFSVDNSGVVRVANNALLDYNSLAAGTQLPVRFELFVNITNVDNASFTELNRRVVVALQQVYPAAPTALSATVLPGLRVQLAWSGNSSATRYNVKRSTTPGGPYATLANVTSESCVDAAVSVGQTFYYVVSAVSDSGEGTPSGEVGVQLQSIPNFGFEYPALGSGHEYVPDGAFWTFTGTNDNGAGVLGNGSAFSNPPSPEGTQAAFVQRYGSMSQLLTGFVPGVTYSLSYMAAQRSGPDQQGGQTWNVKIDNTVIQAVTVPGGTSYAEYSATFVATSNLHTLTFEGTDLPGGDNTVFIDNVQLALALAVPNFGFESPSVPNYQYNPSGATWTFSGSSPNGSGLIANGSGFGNPPAPQGSQAAFVQQFGTISQSIPGFVPGNAYTVGYYAAQRSGANQNGGESWNVMIDDTVIESNSPGGTSYAFHSAPFVATAASHILKFVGTDLAGGDNTVFIDRVFIGQPLQAFPAPTVTLTSPTDGSLAFAGSPINLSASVIANSNVIDAVEFRDGGSLIATVSNAPYAFSWSTALPGTVHRLVARARFNDGGNVDSAPVNVPVVNSALNLGFESPEVSSHEYNPSGAAWVFMDLDSDGSGILPNGSAFGNPPAPEGDQAAFLQSYGEFSQVLTGFAPGTDYTLTYRAAQRTGGSQHGGQTWNVMIDGQVIETNDVPGSSSYTLHTTGFTATSMTHALRFVGTDLLGDDNTVFIDQVAISPGIGAPLLTLDTSPVTAREAEGGEVTFVAEVSGGEPMSYQWQKVAGVVVDLPGATNATLTLSNLQFGDAGSYRLRASNSVGVLHTAARALTVTSVPAPVNNVIASMAAQTGPGSGTFVPTWSLAPGSLIAGQSPGSAIGDFSRELTGRSVESLTAGDPLGLSQVAGDPGYPITTSHNYVTCGNGSGAGASVVYALTGAGQGYTLSNIVVYGGWADAGRDQQAYTLSYSTVGSPATFHVLRSVSYNPSNPSSAQSATRASLTALSGVIASNVAAVKFDFTSPSSENGYVGYGEIQVFGVPTVPPAVPAMLAVVLGGSGNLVMSVSDLVPGRNYEVQSTTNLVVPEWIVEDSFQAASTSTWITNSISESAWKFFRLVGD